MIKDAYDQLSVETTPFMPTKIDIHADAVQKKNHQRNFILQPHAAQVVSVLLFFLDAVRHSVPSSMTFTNRLIQIGTGEGKSVTLAVTSCVLALLGFDVDCACYNEYLSRRDHESFSHIFKTFGLSDSITYNTFNTLADSFINTGFKGRGIRGVVTDLFQPPSAKKSTPSSISKIVSDASSAFVSNTSSFISGILGGEKVRPRILLIDEVDVFFSKDFYGSAYCPVATISHPTISLLLKDLYSNRIQIRSYEEVVISKVLHTLSPDGSNCFKQCFDK